jgi:cold shock CspA family protein
MRLDETLGFLEAADGHEIYFHKSSVLNDGFPHLVPGSRVAFFEESGREGTTSKHGKGVWPPRPAMMRMLGARQLWSGRRLGLVQSGRRTMLKT